MEEQKDWHLELVGVRNTTEAYQKIKEWSSNLSDEEHLVRSVVLDIHLGIETLLRQILYHFFKELVFQEGDKQADEKRIKQFEKMIRKLSFGDMYRVLKPILESWPKPDLTSIQDINGLRTQLAHGSPVDRVRYKGRNPFKDADSFAQLFLDAWAVRKELREFYQHSIEDPRALAKHYYEYYTSKTLK